MNLGLDGKTALVLGATSGLGLATARALAGEGARVVLAGRREEVARAEAERLPGAIGEQVDLASPASIDALVERTRASAGEVDVVVLNSGGPPAAPAHELTPEAVAAATETLLLGHVRLVRLLLPGMRERGWGRVVAIGSSGIQAPLPSLALSNVARAGLAAYLKTLAAEVAADGVTVNMVLPGRIDTARVAELDRARAGREGSTPEEVERASKATIPAGRYGTPDEFGRVAAFLCSDVASYVTGEQLRVDGGLVRAY